MSSGNASMQRSAPVSQPWTTRAIIARHRGIAIAAAVVIVVMAALLAVGIAGSNAGSVTDRSTCAAWSSANQDQQAAYARLYVREHGALASGRSDPASVEAAINRGCMQAFGSDAADLVNVYQAINRQY
jgi:hypothetical protein